MARDSGGNVTILVTGATGSRRGSHICLGHNLTRIEGEEVLGALRTVVSATGQVGEERWTRSTLHGMHTFPVALDPEAR
jgi:cytochrome P450